MWRLALLGVMTFIPPSFAGTVAAPEDAYVYIVSPKHGEVLSSPITVVFGLSGMGIAPAGVQKDNTGHHHLLIDTGLPPLDVPIRSDAKHIHFGGGQTQTTLELPPGEHTLQLLLGDFTHIPHARPIASEVIKITIKP